ncbi:MAG: 4-(cytidine 5'-diphospho)-2-C-methyl-D-erythritol kinase [Prevotellaceae bacterium]|nr:4-(cytidine 5'-diphospho)-2-C-methyl-D-erythritol kinase [Prevotellaceae bacterium]
MITFPNAKINLGLNVVSRRPDGYHNLETVFYPINLCDALEFVPAVTTSLKVAGLPVSGDIEHNLVVRAFRLLQRDFQLPELEIALLKNIPMGAGLGGGSADAAFMLKMVNEHFKLALSEDTLETYAAKLGADCAFFIRNKPVFAAGIGNEFRSLEVSLKGYYLVLVKPDVHVSTAEAYAHVACQRWQVPLMEVMAIQLEQWREYLFNDFEISVFEIHPELAVIKQQLYGAGAVYAAMSGSGSTLYGIFKTKPEHNFPNSRVFVIDL